MSNNTVLPLHELPVTFRFTHYERQTLGDALAGLRTNPYTQYHDFIDEVRGLVKNGEVPARFTASCGEQRLIDRVHNPFIALANCPIDIDQPIWDNTDPVNDKRRRKTTFVAEGFLALYAILMEQPILSYVNVNDGDRFQDIYPRTDMQETQSQKAIVPLFFHKDLANHFARPDYVNMLSMRAHPGNETYTTFACNADALALLDDETRDVLRRVEFYTPFDDLTVKGGSVELGRAPDHPVLSDDYDLRFFENRTEGLTERAEVALEKLTRALHSVKRRVHMMPGDFIGVYNNFSVHSKEIHDIADVEALKSRWIIKTVNVDDLSAHEQHFVAGDYGVVNG